MDLENKRKVQRVEGENIAKKFIFKFFKVSNKDGTNVEESSRELINLILSKTSNVIKPKNAELSKKQLKKRNYFFSRIKC